MGGKKDINTILLISAVLLIALIIPLAVLTVRSGKRSILEDPLMKTSEEVDDPGVVEREADPVEDGVLRLASDEGPGDLDIARNSNGYYIPLNVFDRLVEIDDTEDGTPEIKPSLATEWSVSDDGKTYSFTLRDDVVFSNGTPLKAGDVKFSLSRLLTVPDSEQIAFADMIEGADELMNGSASDLSGIEVLDDTHLKIHLKYSFPSFLSMLGAPACSVLCEEAVRAAGDSYGSDIENIIGSGPYVLTENTEDKCTLEVNPRYWGEIPSVKKAELTVMVHAVMNREFKTGNIDMLDLTYLGNEARVYYLEEAQYKDKLISKDKVETAALLLNVDMAPLNSLKVRKAIQYAIDRERIIQEVFGGYAETTDCIFPKGLIGYCEENQGWLKYDPEEAKRLLNEAGIGNDSTIELAYGSVADVSIQKMTKIVQENLNAVGLNAVTVIYDPDSRLYLRRNGKIMAYEYSWIADYNDPDNFIYTLFGSPESSRRYSSNYKDLSVLNRIEKARTIADDDERLKEYAALERKLVVDDAAWVPLYSSKQVIVKGERVSDYTPYWAGWSDVILKNVEMK